MWRISRCRRAHRSAVRSEDAAEPRAEHGMPQAERDIGFEIAELVATIVTPCIRAQPVKGLACGDQAVEPVGQLDLVAAPRLLLLQHSEDLGLNDISSDNR